MRNMTTAALLCAGIASCSQDELPGQSEPLPEGKYPITFTAVQSKAAPKGTPQTRVSDEGTISSWSEGDEIKVKVTTEEDNAKVQESICTLDEYGKITNYNPQLYWQTTGKHTINAWYSNIDGQSTGTGKTVSLADQSQGLAYVLKAKEAEFSFENRTNSTELSFTHQLAKIRVELTGEKAADVTSVSIQGYTSCTVNQGAISTQGATSGEIKMHPNTGTKVFEANVVPGQAITKFQINNDGKWIGLKQSVTPMVGKWHKITIDVVKAAMNPDELPDEINNNEEYTVSGTGTKGITITGGTPTIIFKNDVTLKSETAIEIKGGSPKLIFEGTASLESTGDGKGAISLSGNASVDISGGGTLSLKANTADNYDGTWYEGAILGSAGGKACGSISISDVTLNIEANAYNAAIGSGERGSSCGDIAITNATVRITGCAGGAGIGTSIADMGTSSCGDIRIKNSDIEITYGNHYAFQGAAIGCAGGGTSGGISANYSNTVKGIYITLKSGQSQSDFLGKLTTTSATGSDKVGQGYCEDKKYGTITNGVHWYNANGSEIK